MISPSRVIFSKIEVWLLSQFFLQVTANSTKPCSKFNKSIGSTASNNVNQQIVQQLKEVYKLNTGLGLKREKKSILISLLTY